MIAKVKTVAHQEALRVLLAKRSADGLVVLSGDEPQEFTVVREHRLPGEVQFRPVCSSEFLKGCERRAVSCIQGSDTGVPLTQE